MSSVKPSIPKGTRDFSPTVLAKRNYLKDQLIDAFERYGFQPIETPSFERSETLLGKYGDEGDRLIFKILNSGDKVKNADLEALQKGELSKFSNSLSQKALRYDLTVPFARYVAQYQNDIVFPFRRYQIQTVWRADRPQQGRFQEFLQCDADVVGERSLWQEVEGVLLYDRVFSKLKLKGVQVHLNHRKILAGIAQCIGAESQLINFTVALDKLSKIGKEGVIKELQSKGFSPESIERLQAFLSLEGDFETQISAVARALEGIEIAQEGIEELKFIYDQLKRQSLKTVSLKFDVTLARGLNYYTGLILEVTPPDGVKMGSIGGGGRYDKLTDMFGLKNTSGFGISFGFDRIYLVLEELNLFPATLDHKTQLMFLNFGDDSVSFCFDQLIKLRDQELSCELYPKPAKLKKQLNYANQRSIPYVVIMGSEEMQKEVFVLKNMVTGSETEHPLAQMQKIKEELN
ncbi:histidine--tRNA ligase [Flavobacteriaceae bacterium]|nr:histidine--tRNA ligase [Flavobacteriaceae bacterium]